MRAFFVRWRSARQFREYELFASETIGACLWAALQVSGGAEIWQSGTLWKCPGCGDRTVRTEEFLEGLRRAEEHLRGEAEGSRLVGEFAPTVQKAALEWLQSVAMQMFGCERDRVYMKEEGATCTFAGQTYISRI